MSHPVRVRGLKLLVQELPDFESQSHPVRVRGLKHLLTREFNSPFCRTPCGCVD